LAWWWATQTGWLSPEFWLGFSFVTLGWVVVLADILHFRFRFPDPYHRLRVFEADGSVYRGIGIRVFKRFVVNGDYMNRWKRSREPDYRLIHTRSDAVTWEHLSRATEAAHALHLLVLCPAIVLALHARRLAFAAGVLALLIGFDLYPVLLQRYNRSRISKISTTELPTKTVNA